MSVIASVHGVLGAHRYSQEEITKYFTKIVSPEGNQEAVINRIHQATEVKFRSLALPAEGYAGLDDFTDSNDAYISVALELGAKAILSALEQAGLRPDEVDFIMATSITGLATPSIETRLVPIVGAAGIARLDDYLIGHPNDVAVLLSVELCSLTLQRDDLSMANIVSSGLFGDGAGALVMVGAERAKQMGIKGPRVIASNSRVYPDTEFAMGWNIGSGGFSIILAPSVSEIVLEHIGRDVDSFLSIRGLKRADISQWVCHTGGPKILQAVEESLDLSDNELAVSWLSDVLAGRGTTKPAAGTSGLVMAMVLLVLVALERIAELIISKGNLTWSFAQGGIEFGRSHYKYMVVIHIFLLLAFALAIGSQALRWWCIATLGQRWNTLVVIIPGKAPIATGPYKWLKHPNYVAVVIEGFALPMSQTKEVMIDLLVAGAGPVGLVTAIHAAEAGLDVAVVEPRVGTIDKACGEGLMPKALEHLSRIGVNPSGVDFFGIRYLSGSSSVDARFTIDEIVQSNSSVTAAGVQSRYLVGADGLHSSVRANLGLEMGAKKMEVYWLPHAEVYVTPVSEDSVGLAILGYTASYAVLGHFASELRIEYMDVRLQVGFAEAEAAVKSIVSGEISSYDAKWRKITRSYRMRSGGLLWASSKRAIRPAIVPAARALPPVFRGIVRSLS
eukprot:gene5838-5905_t